MTTMAKVHKEGTKARLALFLLLHRGKAFRCGAAWQAVDAGGVV
jgi:hypothetical protein